MKTPEDEAFDDLARNQGAWGGGFPAKKAMAADKLEDDPLAELDGILERLAAGNYTITKYKGTHDVGYMMYARDILAAEKEKNMERDADKVQEPVACVQDLDEVKRKHLVYEKGMDWKDPLYTTPPPRTEQEPVGKVVEAVEGAFRCEFTAPLPAGTKLYTTPPQREWVKLTDGELADLWYKESLDWMEFARAHEAKLKEKNT